MGERTRATNDEAAMSYFDNIDVLGESPITLPLLMSADVGGNILSFFTHPKDDGDPHKAALRDSILSITALECSRCLPICSRDDDFLSNREQLYVSAAFGAIRNEQELFDNIILRHFGGGIGLHDALDTMLSDYSCHRVVLRGDTLHCLAEILQAKFIDRIQRVHLSVLLKFRTRDLESYEYDVFDVDVDTPVIRRTDIVQYDEVEPRDSRLQCCVSSGFHSCGNCSSAVAELANSHWASFKWCEADPLLHEIISDEGGLSYIFDKVIRSLAFRAGVLRMTKTAANLFKHELIHDTIVSISLACNQSMHKLSTGRCPGVDGCTYLNTSPPLKTRKHRQNTERKRRGINSLGTVFTESTIVPQQIRDATESMGMNRIYGYDDFGTHWVQTSSSDTIAGEVDKAKARYVNTDSSENESCVEEMEWTQSMEDEDEDIDEESLASCDSDD